MLLAAPWLSAVRENARASLSPHNSGQAQARYDFGEVMHARETMGNGVVHRTNISLNPRIEQDHLRIKHR